MHIKVFAVALLVVAPLFGQSRVCKDNPKVVKACFIVHGRATFGPGTPALRIWPIGTKRMLGVTAGPIADDADDPIYPNNMRKVIQGDEEVFGDFEVCPFTPERKGAMQMVCIQSVSKLAVKPAISKK
ncbi:hypothetical protein [Acidicapsa ligni]|uniref:hypothetical protein n=1 Tax=Acidicapsa ligni TaxID=542300 RepID=UPI0021DFE2D4|nr:hypothetical protein [Acidicapsa ligni]